MIFFFFFAHHLILHECTTAKYRLTSTIYTADARFVLSGSDDGNVRIWKARASDRLGVVTSREKAAMEYRDSLRERWKYDAEIDRVSRYVQMLIPRPSCFPFTPAPLAPPSRALLTTPLFLSTHVVINTFD